MARPTKQGLNYFPLDVDFFDDEKIEFVNSRFGLKGEAIAVRLLCKVYRNGYFLEFNEDSALLFAKRVGGDCQHSLVKDVVYELIKRGFFDRSIFEKFAVLTSNGIQKRYLQACMESKRKNFKIDPKFKIDSLTPEETGLTPEETGLTGWESTQRKEKESKEKEMREKNAHEVFPGNKNPLFMDYDSTIRELQFSNVWKEELMIHFGIQNSSLMENAIREFMRDTKLDGKYPRTLTDTKQHFRHCLNKGKYLNDSKNQTNEGKAGFIFGKRSKPAGQRS